MYIYLENVTKQTPNNTNKSERFGWRHELKHKNQQTPYLFIPDPCNRLNKARKKGGIGTGQKKDK